MALTIDTLRENKRVFNPDQTLMNSGVGIWNLTQSSLTYAGVEAQISDIYYVTDETEMRMDLVSYTKYGSMDSFGSFLKFNSISNPFSIDSGQILYLPTKQTIDAAFQAKKQLLKGGNTNTSQGQAFRKAQENKIVKGASDGRKKYLESKAKKLPTQSLPPNILQEGDRATLRVGSNILFGPDAGGGRNL